MKVLDSELIQKLKSLVRNERELIAEILRHLREVEKRKLYLQRGYSSMFAFCTEALGYSEAEAHIRIQAMRLMSTVAMVEAKIESGELSLSVAARAQGCFRKTDLTKQVKEEIVRSLVGKSTRQAERELAAHFPDSAKPEVQRAASGEQTRLEFTISNACLEKLNRLRERAAHENFSGRLDVLFESLIDLALKKYDPHTDARVLSARKVNGTRSRYIPAGVRREVWRRADGQCQYQNQEHRCSSRYGLQIDHIGEYCNGGSNELKNLQLLCGAHNRWRSRATA